MIIYIFNQNNHGIDRKKKSLHTRTWEEVHIFWGNTVNNVENQPA